MPKFKRSPKGTPGTRKSICNSMGLILLEKDQSNLALTLLRSLRWVGVTGPGGDLPSHLLEMGVEVRVDCSPIDICFHLSYDRRQMC